MPKIKIITPAEAKSLYKTQIPVLITHVNYGNHLGHDSLISILHEARLRFIKDYGMHDEISINGTIGLMITHLAVSYLSEAFHGDLLEVEILVADITKKTCDFYYKMIKRVNGKEQMVAVAMTRLLFIDLSNRKSVSIPSNFLQAITQT